MADNCTLPTMYRVYALLILAFVLLIGKSTSAVSKSARQEKDSLKGLLDGNIPDSTRVNVLIKLTSLLSDQDVDAALAYIKEAKHIVDSSSATEKRGKVYFLLGVVYMNKSDYSQALSYLFKALKFYELQNDFVSQAKCYNNIGALYALIGMHNQSIVYLTKALTIADEHPGQLNVGVIYLSIGNAMGSLNRKTEAIVYFNKALAEGRKHNNDYEVSLALINLTETHLTIKQYAKAWIYLEQATLLNLQRQDKHHLAICYFLKGKLTLAEGKLGDAEKALLQSEHVANGAGLRQRLSEIYDVLADVYYRQNKMKLAYDTRMKHEQLEEALLNEGVMKQISELQASYELEKKNNEIALLNKNQLLAEAERNEERLIRNTLVLVCMISVLVVFSLIRNVRLKRKLNEALSSENKQIGQEKAEVEKANLLLQRENASARYEMLKSKIDPHFLFNCLSTAQSLVLIDNAKAIDFIEKFSLMYRHVIESAEKQSNTLEEELVIVDNFLYLQKVRFGANLAVERNISGELINYRLPAFALQMVVENALKHNVISSSGKLLIRIFTDEDFVVVENNLQPRLSNQVSLGIGQKNITERYKLLTEKRAVFYKEEKKYIVRLPLLTTVDI